MDLEHVQRPLKSALRFLAAVPLIFLLNGCSTSMDNISDPNEPLTALEGIIIGSTLIRTVQSDSQLPYRVAPMFMVSTDRVKFLLSIEELKGLGYLTKEPNIVSKQYSLNIAPNEEKVFVMRLPAGPYHMRTLQAKGYEDATALLGLPFTVAPGTVTYIGRVVFEVNKELPLSHGFPRGYQRLKPAIKIEDAQESTVESIHSSYGGIVHQVTKNLMRPVRP